MRDINRIELFCNKLAEIWKENYPDWRFGQLVDAILIWSDNEPLFYIEDDRFIEELEDFQRFTKRTKEYRDALCER